MLEARDSGHGKDHDHYPDATSCARVTTNSSSSDGTPYKHKIEQENSADGKAMLASGCHFTNELDNYRKCVLFGMKNKYCHACFNKDKSKEATPLCQIKRYSKVTEKMPSEMHDALEF